MSHKPLIIHHPDGTWQAWCPACRWESKEYPAHGWAKVAADRHAQSQQEADDAG